jgi:4-hydroxybenzoate polyprenyltransferase
MRSAGCVINDFIDRDIDIHVRRTKNRPLPDGKLSNKEAIIIFIVLIVFAFLLVLTLNIMTIAISILSLSLTIIYPLMKRYTYFPQLVLGVAFSSAILMAWASMRDSLPLECWLMFLANIFWILAYDTEYAMIDREDDIKINIRSTAIIFGNLDRIFIGIFQLCMILIMVILALKMRLNLFFYCSLIIISKLFIYQHILLSFQNNRSYLKAFLNNNYVGVILFSGVLCNINYY